MSDKHLIEKYLLSTCLFVIDDFNDEHKGIKVYSPELSEIAKKSSEQNLVFRIGYPFGHRATYSVQTDKGGKKGFSDIEVKSKNFKIEVKFLKKHKSNDGNTDSGKMGWKPIQDDFDWLQNEIERGNKGQCAFVMGWYNTTERFSELAQIGRERIENSKDFKVSPDKEVYFPFIKYNSERNTKSVTYKYEKAFEPNELPLKIKSNNKKMHCIFLGQPDDKFHVAIYY
jgi:hypothetical protein